MSYDLIGENVIEINWKNFTSGMSTNINTQDGGFSIGHGIPGNGTTASVINPIAEPGILNFPTTPTDKSTNLTGQMIASCEAPAFAYTRLFVSEDGAGQDGRFFHCSSSGTLTEVGAEDTTNNYIYGRTDMILYKSEAYITNSGDIVRWSSVGASNTFDYAFFSFSDSFAPHPALVYEDNAFYGDGNLLLRQTSAGGTPATILTLPDNQVIVALGIDPGSGKMLISVVDAYDVSGLGNTGSRVLYYDGFSNKASKLVPIETMVTAFYNLGSSVFVFYGQNMGFWNGSGITFLRELNIDLDNSELVYKHHITNIDDILYIVEKNRILAYGKILKDQSRVFWYALQNVVVATPTDYNFVVDIGNNLLATSFATDKFYTFATKTVTSVNTLTASRFYTLEYNFSRPVTFDQCMIEYIDAIPTATAAPSGVALVELYTDDDSVTQISTVQVPDGLSKTTFSCTWPSIQTRNLQIRYIPTVAAAIKRITIFYTPAH